MKPTVKLQDHNYTSTYTQKQTRNYRKFAKSHSISEIDEFNDESVLSDLRKVQSDGCAINVRNDDKKKTKVIIK